MPRSAPLPRRLRRRAVAAVTTALLVLALAVPAGADIVEISGDGLVDTMRWAGNNRYDTAQLIATEGPADAPVFGGDTVVVARGDAFPDGLAGSYLAGQVGAPVLLTTPTTVPAETTAALSELDPRNVFVLGGDSAISRAVERQLGAGRFVARIDGDDRYETAAAIARRGATAGTIGQVDGHAAAFLATGARGADALVAGPLAAGADLPVLLTRPNALPEATADALEDLAIEHVIIVGGEMAVTPEVAAAVTDLGITVSRLSGSNREATAVEVADFATGELGWTVTELHVASGADRSFADSLALAPRSALTQSPILLVRGNAVSDAVGDYLAAAEGVDLLGVAGGEAAVSAQAVASVRTRLALEAAGLAFPRGMTMGAAGLYIAEVGFGGDECVGEGDEEICFGDSGAIRLLGQEEPAAGGLPSVNIGAGPTDVAISADDRIAATLGLGVPAADRDAIAAGVPIAGDLGTLIEITAEGYKVVADLAQWETENNADDLGDDSGDPPLNSNPYSVARDHDRNVWVVADAGGNSLLQVTDDGAIELIAVLPMADTDEGPRQYVPTSVVVHGGKYYVGGLAGEAPGAATIYEIDPAAARPATPTSFADGFSFVLDIAFDDAGNLYVAEASFEGPGNIVRVAPGGERTDLGGGGLNFPVGLQAAGDTLYVSHCPFCPTGGEVLGLSIGGAG